MEAKKHFLENCSYEEEKKGYCIDGMCPESNVSKFKIDFKTDGIFSLFAEHIHEEDNIDHGERNYTERSTFTGDYLIENDNEEYLSVSLQLKNQKKEILKCSNYNYSPNEEINLNDTLTFTFSKWRNNYFSFTKEPNSKIFDYYGGYYGKFVFEDEKTELQYLDFLKTKLNFTEDHIQQFKKLNGNIEDFVKSNLGISCSETKKKVEELVKDKEVREIDFEIFAQCIWNAKGNYVEAYALFDENFKDFLTKARENGVKDLEFIFKEYKPVVWGTYVVEENIKALLEASKGLL